MEQQLHNVFMSFAGYGTRQMVSELEGAKFAKLLKDARIIDRSFTTTDVDIIFAKVKSKGSRKINFEQFLVGLQQVADRKNVSPEYVVNMILAAWPQANNATAAEFVRHHDDKSTYTGVYAKGGPTNVDKSRAAPGGLLSTLCDRSPADVRGVKPLAYQAVR